MHVRHREVMSNNQVQKRGNSHGDKTCRKLEKHPGNVAAMVLPAPGQQVKYDRENSAAGGCKNKVTS
jgi:hypothetical protein